jgi:hypothetical protein
MGQNAAQRSLPAVHDDQFHRDIGVVEGGDSLRYALVAMNGHHDDGNRGSSRDGHAAMHIDIAGIRSLGRWRKGQAGSLSVLTIEVPKLRRRLFGGPICIAVFSYRYDAPLVHGLIENIRPMVHGWVSWDDRQAKSAFTGDNERRKTLIQAAYDAGAQWVLAIDPDERLEQAGAALIPWMTRAPMVRAWSFRLREMYAPDAYRVDGVWGRKRQTRLFRLLDSQFPISRKGTFETAELHQPWVPSDRWTGRSGLNLYHLKMITPERRQARAALYNALDPKRQYQKIGYDYLADDSGAVLETIPVRRSYRPAFRDDGGLWMARPDEVSQLDPP